jgi:hypothetical protein
MSNAAVPGAPAPAAAPSAPTSAPASTGAPTPSAPASSEAPASGTQPITPAAPRRDPVPWKTKVKLGEEELETEVDVAPFLESYKRKVKLDGEEVEVGPDDAFKSYERHKTSMKRFEEAAKIRTEAEQRHAQLDQQVEQIRAIVSDPVKGFALLEKNLGTEKVDEWAIQRALKLVELEQMTPEQRQQHTARTEAERQAAARQAELDRREAAIRQQEERAKAEREKRITQMAAERQRAMIAEWTPKLDAAGLPAMLPGPDGKSVPNERIFRMVAETMRRARDAKAPITIDDAIAMVRDEYEALVGPALERRRRAELDALQQQPGTPPRAPNGRFAGQELTAEELSRQLRQSWRR